MKDKLIHTIINQPDKYGVFYRNNLQDILIYSREKIGIKTDTYVKDLLNELDNIRFSTIFSDFTNVYPFGAGTELHIMPIPDTQLTLTDGIFDNLVKEGQNPILHAAILVQGPQVLSPFLRELEPMIKSEKLLVHNSRIALGLTNKSHKNGGRVWKIFEIDPASPYGNWLCTESAIRENTLPIDFNPENLIDKNELFDLTIPYFKGIPFSELDKILDDHADHLSELRQELNNIITKSKHDRTNISELKHDVIQPKIDKIGRDFKKISEIHTLKVGGTLIGSLTLGLMSLTTGGVAAAAGGLLGSGGLGLALKEFSEYRKDMHEIRDNPLYLLWKLKQRK